MCGIAGLALRPDAAPPDPAVLAALARALGHRGPDGSGSVVLGQAALVHTRLAIIDVAGGDQPFFAGAATLIANGEIYNAPELRAAMPGTAFATLSDCEPPLHLFLRDGHGYAAALRGMFAIAVHDAAGHSVTLTRDAFGIKPLYYAEIADGVAFASEPQALLAAGVCDRGVRAAARCELLQMQFCSGAETIFPGIFRALPGETLRIAGGRLTDRSRIAALPAGGPDNIGEAAALARLDAALLRSVDFHQRSDVPYGMFLSGGIDSACILAVMARLNGGKNPVLAFTAGFDVPGAADERAQAAALARSVGAHHETMEISRATVWRHLPEIVAAMDDPAADYAIIPTWFLARRARQDVKVVLCGEGGDEIFGGLRAVSAGDAPVVPGRPPNAPPRRVRRFGRVAQPSGWVARRVGGGAGGRIGSGRIGRRSVAAAGGPGHRHGRLAAARSAAEAGPLPDGAWGGGAHAVSRSCRGPSGFLHSGRAESARWTRKISAAALAGGCDAGGPAVRRQTGFYSADRRLDRRRRRAAGPAGGAAGGGCGGCAAGAGGKVVCCSGRQAGGRGGVDAAVLRAVASNTCGGAPLRGGYLGGAGVTWPSLVSIPRFVAWWMTDDPPALSCPPWRD